MKRRKLRELLLVTLLLFVSSNVYANCEYNTFKNNVNFTFDKSYDIMPEDVIQYKNFFNKFESSRETIYNALDLTDEQITAREALIKKNANAYNEKFSELLKESYKYKTLKDANVSDKNLLQQRKVVKNIKNEIEYISKNEDKEFKKLLTHDQKSKYAMIKKLERQDYKNAKKEKDYYKSNPRMRSFGNPQKVSR